MDLQNVLFVVVVVFLITFIPISAHIYVFPDFIVWGSSWSATAFYLVFDMAVLNLWFNYMMAIVTDPGRVPPKWEPAPTSGVMEVKNSTSAPRYCRTCQQFKPPRTHHCSQCDRCVLKMDHHCPWVNNCIGFNNQAYFVRFLFWVDVATGMCVTVLAWRLYDWFTQTYPAWYYSDVVLYQLVITIIDICMAVPVFLTVGALSIYHFYYIVTNCTTIESMEKERKAVVRRMDDGMVGNIENAYDIDWWTNIKSVFGRNPIFWCFPRSLAHPVPAECGDGTVFPINMTHVESWSAPAEPKRHHGRHVRRGSEGYEIDMGTTYYAEQAADPYAGWHHQVDVDGGVGTQYQTAATMNGYSPAAMDDYEDHIPLAEVRSGMRKRSASRGRGLPDKKDM
ncbi:hypothetical protein AMAG_08495 [Allomyces macrogynus ATCC 38327]|uniref:Palmitoyltransferase n=1 Tax=Allomyces macrogynus (strain ATCC 38327) TaxID=578462 RepID=A0A0L0SLM8_ALLM3|nr:hypothetical protein AMAG_08495 [Allomyces macrogynus ATCC 38327]|eukprot:KNE63358.1 hypothetical protein AMAG_08495 [Allomyces macrogynus ATCC 38327]